MKKSSKQEYIIPLLLLNTALTIRAIAASYRASEWAAEGLVNKISMTANYLFFASVFILIGVVFSLFATRSNSRIYDTLTIISVLLGVVIIGLSMFL